MYFHKLWGDAITSMVIYCLKWKELPDTPSVLQALKYKYFQPMAYINFKHEWQQLGTNSIESKNWLNNYLSTF